MCIIAYKPQNTAMPTKDILENCFDNNPDGAGFMYAYDNVVHIEKGFMDFESFYNALLKHKPNWTKLPFVLHFRISTQAGVNPDCTHPFPLSANMDRLRKLKTATQIGIAHNGIVSLTSCGWNKTITYSDTMKFITDYLSLIIKNNNYYRNKDTMTLIERLAGSKLAILSADGHCELVGNFQEVKGIYYSNSSYQERIPAPSLFSPYSSLTKAWTNSTSTTIVDDEDFIQCDICGKTEWKEYATTLEGEVYCEDCYATFAEDGDFYYTEMIKAAYNKKSKTYDFPLGACPVALYDDYDYCEKCKHKKECFNGAL